MQMLSEDDRNLKEMTAEELALAWDLWFDLAQTTNDHDPRYSHGVFAGMSATRPPASPSHASDERS
jgi:hypothetical protein